MKSIYDEAVETLNKYRNRNYNSTNKDEVELANAINVILPIYVKQEKLLGLYKEYKDLCGNGGTVEEYDFLEQKIKELENDNT